MRVGIVSTGPVGAMAACALVMCGVGREFMLVDINRGWAQTRNRP